MLGWSGYVLRVNLDDGSFRREPIKKDLLRSAIGGVGLATDFMFGEARGRIDPLSRGNAIHIFTGPFTGTPIVSSGRFCLVTTSPLTNYYLQSHCGGQFGPELKYSGHDG
ncbi:MAG: aldehyde ferredoxin oxidoreductase, partial [Candidatus Methanofastidiosa archaeon]|nr:aldehyde ferredoxin oxidoreductase [Candidatus Methanofastidiosa archaeon]